MAVEYDLYSGADLTLGELDSFLAESLGSVVTEPGVTAREGMVTLSHLADPDEEARAPQVFGFPHRLTTTFRFSNTATEWVENLNVGLMMQAVLQLLDRFPPDGVLLFNGEEVVVQKLGGQVALNSDWEEWGEREGLRMLREGRDFRSLPQPLL